MKICERREEKSVNDIPLVCPHLIIPVGVKHYDPLRVEANRVSQLTIETKTATLLISSETF
mgnify:FL=1